MGGTLSHAAIFLAIVEKNPTESFLSGNPIMTVRFMMQIIWLEDYKEATLLVGVSLLGNHASLMSSCSPRSYDEDFLLKYGSWS